MFAVVRDLRSPRSVVDSAEAAAYQEHLLAEYVLARLAHGVADGTIRAEAATVVQFLASAGVWVWEIEPAHADRFLGQQQRSRASETRRWKAGAIELFFRFLELRYRGELHELTGGRSHRRSMSATGHGIVVISMCGYRHRRRRWPRSS